VGLTRGYWLHRCHRWSYLLNLFELVLRLHRWRRDSRYWRSRSWRNPHLNRQVGLDHSLCWASS
jgi:hypothetical protein